MLNWIDKPKSKRDYLNLLKEKNKRIRKEYASKGILQFGQTYFPEYFSLPVPKCIKRYMMI